jgi:hypothetical protein
VDVPAVLLLLGLVPIDGSLNKLVRVALVRLAHSSDTFGAFVPPTYFPIVPTTGRRDIARRRDHIFEEVVLDGMGPTGYSH